MKKKITLIVIILAFVLLIGGASLLYQKLGSSELPDSSQIESSTESSEPTKILAPDFTVYDLYGKEVKLSDYLGTPVVLNFWASWCGPCQMEMPAFQRQYQALEDEVAFLMINMTDGSRETVESASKFIVKQGYDFPVFYDTKYSAATVYGVYSLPSTLFIDAEGYVVAAYVGAIDESTLQQKIDQIR